MNKLHVHSLMGMIYMDSDYNIFLKSRMFLAMAKGKIIQPIKMKVKPLAQQCAPGRRRNENRSLKYREPLERFIEPTLRRVATVRNATEELRKSSKGNTDFYKIFR